MFRVLNMLAHLHVSFQAPTIETAASAEDHSSQSLTQTARDTALTESSGVPTGQEKKPEDAVGEMSPEVLPPSSPPAIVEGYVDMTCG